jgi:hypothetical protein
VTLLVATYYPAIMMVFRAPLPVIYREYLGGGLGGMLSLISYSMAPVYGSFLLSWLFLYERCRGAWGEPAASANRRYVPSTGRVGERVRLGTKFWLALPAMLALLLVVVPFTGWNERFGDNISTAALEGRHEDVQRMIDRGDDPNESVGRGRLPMVVAVQNGDVKMAELLLSRGARVNGRDKLAGPLHYAVMTHRMDMLDWLLAKGANVNARDNTGDTPLSLAAKNGEAAMARKLLARGADPALKNEEGLTAIDHARRLGRREMIALLENHR